MKSTYRIVTGSDERSSKRLCHYGVLGMKWGVRRTPEQLGRHTIKKGTTMYRTTVDPNEATKGSTYVSYLPPDRDLYRVWDRPYSNNKLVLEKKYKSIKDLTVPSRQELTEVIDSVIKKDVDGRFLNEVANTKRNWKMNYYGDSFVLNTWKQMIADNPKLDDEAVNEANGDALKYREAARKRVSNYLQAEVDDFVRKMSNESPDELRIDVVKHFGSATQTRQAVIDELKKRGYNAMVDEASVGGWPGRLREGVDPLIVFDQEESLRQVNIKPIKKTTWAKARARYVKWSNTANSNRNTQW